MGFVSAAITGENQFTNALTLQHQLRHGLMFDVSVSGTFVATITVQRSFDKGVTWLDVKPYTASAEEIGEDAALNIDYRIGCKTGDYTSGTANVILGNGPLGL